MNVFNESIKFYSKPLNYGGIENRNGFGHIEKGIVEKFCAPRCQPPSPPHLLLSVPTRGTSLEYFAKRRYGGQAAIPDSLLPLKTTRRNDS